MYFSLYENLSNVKEYVMLNRLRTLYERVLPSRHLRQGVPFLAFLVLGWLGIREFANIRYDIKKKYGQSDAFRERMEKGGKKKIKEIDPEEEYKKLVEDADLDSWFNIRGPRPEEDSRAIQQELREKHQKLDSASN
ncbi:cytochrome c oxidase assembly protein COX16 homolog, mitochondrial-like [Styela clava]|uniref:cytochrome c oxidase assembly protein COX16 homolog, mitochondrial-like n=1 Tax=Styela clava TaxID=7725 RepID=UPI001939575A|nr:cytochrome c oxidase assembly protein COX16 homolog, mitochondrial-like [Styela clava]